MWLSVLLKNKKLKYKKDNLFVTRVFASKARTMSFTFGTLSLLILLSLLCLNFSSINKIISKEELLEKLWNDKYYLDENVLLVNMTRLKKKMTEIGIVHLLENIRGKGWKL